MEKISKETIHRLAKDITQIVKCPLNDNGIYYQHDEEDMLKGYAMIVGSEDTGISPILLRDADEFVKIPLLGFLILSSNTVTNDCMKIIWFW